MGQSATSVEYQYAEKCVEGVHTVLRLSDIHLIPVAVGRMKYRGVCLAKELCCQLLCVVTKEDASSPSESMLSSSQHRQL
jgi:hypothetical protein